MKIYILEYKKKGIGRIISFFTRMKYSHTEILIQIGEPSLFLLCGLSYRPKKPDYKIKRLIIPDIIKYSMGIKNKIDVFKIPVRFSIDQITKAVSYWRRCKKDKKVYGFAKLILFPINLLFMPFYRYYYKLKKIPYSPEIDIPNQEVCSTIVDMSIKKAGYDVFPELSERLAYPGLFAKKLKEYKVRDLPIPF